MLLVFRDHTEKQWASESDGLSLHSLPGNLFALPVLVSTSFTVVNWQSEHWINFTDTIYKILKDIIANRK